MIINEGVNTLNVQMQVLIINGTLMGVVTDATTGLPIPGVSINLGGVIKTTGPDGTYNFTDITPGTYAVTFSKTGYQAQSF